MSQEKIFTYCPECGCKTIEFDGIKCFSCTSCGWEFYQNTASAVAGIIEFENKILAVVRNREPGKGLLDFPGGFVDPGETAEQALKRELFEELGIKTDKTSYLFSSPNFYQYKNIGYSTCDLFFGIQPASNNFTLEKSEIAGIKWIERDKLNPDEFAFESMKKAITEYLKTKKPG